MNKNTMTQTEVCNLIAKLAMEGKIDSHTMASLISFAVKNPDKING